MSEATRPRLTQEMIDWFSCGEYDVPLMLRMGVITEDRIVEMWLTCTDSPGRLRAALSLAEGGGDG